MQVLCNDGDRVPQQKLTLVAKTASTTEYIFVVSTTRRHRYGKLVNILCHVILKHQPFIVIYACITCTNNVLQQVHVYRYSRLLMLPCESNITLGMVKNRYTITYFPVFLQALTNEYPSTRIPLSDDWFIFRVLN